MPDFGDQIRPVLGRGSILNFLRPRRQRRHYQADSGIRAGFSNDQVCGQIAGGPALAQCWCIRSNLGHQVAQRSALGPAVTIGGCHGLIVRPETDYGRLLVNRHNGGMESVLWPEIARRMTPDPAGLVAAIAQQWDTGEVLMLAWMDEEALRRTIASGMATYWSRSRCEYWVKGETSGHVQVVKSVSIDCDGDALLIAVDQTDVACHTGTRTCFDQRIAWLEPADGEGN